LRTSENAFATALTATEAAESNIDEVSFIAIVFVEGFPFII
jgi:hypothetical protein